MPQKSPKWRKVNAKKQKIFRRILKPKKQTKTAISRGYQAVEPRIIFPMRKILPAIHKHGHPPFKKVWLYIYTCAVVTVGTWVELPKDCGQN